MHLSTQLSPQNCLKTSFSKYVYTKHLKMAHKPHQTTKSDSNMDQDRNDKQPATEQSRPKDLGPFFFF